MNRCPATSHHPGLLKDVQCDIDLDVDPKHLHHVHDSPGPVRYIWSNATPPIFSVDTKDLGVSYVDHADPVKP